MKRLISMWMVLLLICAIPCGAASVRERTSADILYELGLFSGTGTDKDGKPIYDLDRAPTRSEAITMLVALLGKSEEAKNGTWETPFTDVESWAKPFVGYAYANGLTSGTSATTYGGSELVTPSQYITFVLKALGYSSTTDFQWDKAWILSDRLGITDGEYHAGTQDFFRGDLAMISEGALEAMQRDTTKTLADKLIEAGVFTRAQYDRAYTSRQTGPAQPDVKPVKTALSAQEIGEKCSPAVFYVECYGFNGGICGTGSGFFISADGLAVTNYHVVENKLDLNIFMPDGTAYSDVQVIDCHPTQDLALLRVNGAKNVPYLEINDTDTVKQGQQVYAIGSPEGLENTLSQGIVSNIRRFIGEEEFFQISVPIAPGSSGGALLNQYGELVGVTTAIIGTEGDLNLAVPAKFIADMDRTSQEDYVFYGNDVYNGFSYAYDFGAFSGVDVLSWTESALGFYIDYDFYDFYDLGEWTAADCFANTCYYYNDLLKKNGFEQVYVYEDMEYLGGFEKENERILIEADFDTGELWVWVGYVPTYYEAFPKLPDLGWYLNLDGYGPERGEEFDMYLYHWKGIYTAQTLSDPLDQYFSWLKEEGFVFLGKQDLSYIFEGNGLTVIYIVDQEYICVGVQRK